MSWEKRKDGSEAVLLTIIWAVGSILVTRLWFTLTNNPQIAFGKWHIAHVLFGGLAMLAAILLTEIYKGKEAERIAVALGGIGWGLFIDEVGKYVTMDNDYWFKPAIIIIYVSFVLMFLLYRRLARREKDNGMNLKIIKQTVKVFHITYNKVFRRKFTLWLLAAYSIFFVTDKVWDVIRILVSREKMVIIADFYKNYDLLSKADTYMIGFKIGFDLVTAIMFIGGWYWISKKRRLRGVVYFRYGLLVNILLGSVFKFYFEQFSGVFSLGVSVTIWSLLGEMKNKMLANKN